jgi:hypothetical protein
MLRPDTIGGGQHGQTNNQKVADKRIGNIVQSNQKAGQGKGDRREGFDQKRVSQVPTTLIGREARAEERFRELVAWFMLQGVDEPRARQRACDEIDEDPRKD